VVMSLTAASRWTLPASTTVLIGGGVLSGLVAGLMGTGGAIRSVCLLSFGLMKEAYIGTSAAIAMMVDATRLPVYLAHDFLPQGMVLIAIALIPTAFLGAWIGKHIVQRVQPELFKRVVLCALAVVGVKFLINGARGL